MSSVPFRIDRQPDDTTCGPTCLRAVYRHHGFDPGLDRVISEVAALDRGGTLAALLACHALDHGFSAELTSFNLTIFDPTWFGLGAEELETRLEAFGAGRSDPAVRTAAAAYAEFLRRGGRLRFEDLSPRLIHRLLARGPVLTGLSATWLHRSIRERPDDQEDDDLRGDPVGHFVVLLSVDEKSERVLVADPIRDNRLSPDDCLYSVEMDRLVTAILLGVLTYDGNLLLLEPPSERPFPDAGTEVPEVEDR